jgi:hypothetical protein
MEIKPFFSSSEIEKLAEESNFVRRQSGKINGQLFLDLIVFNNHCLKKQSLNDLAQIVEERYNIQITKQSLHERFNQYALIFLHRAMQSLLNRQLNLDYLKNDNDMKGINRSLIKDSVCFQVDPLLSDIYPGSKGSASEACVRIQFKPELSDFCGD